MSGLKAFQCSSDWWDHSAAIGKYTVWSTQRRLYSNPNVCLMKIFNLKKNNILNIWHKFSIGLQ